MRYKMKHSVFLYGYLLAKIRCEPYFLFYKGIEMATLNRNNPELILDETYQETDFNIMVVAVPSTETFFGGERMHLDVYTTSSGIGLSNFVGRLCVRDNQYVVSPVSHWVSVKDEDLDSWAKIIYDDLCENSDLHQLVFKRELIKLSQTSRLKGLLSSNGIFALSRQVVDGFDWVTNESSYVNVNWVVPNYEWSASN